jgi:hypothetical protein
VPRPLRLLIMLHLFFVALELFHLRLLLSGSLLDLFLELNGVKRLRESVCLYSLISGWRLPLATGRPSWLLVNLLEPGETVFNAHWTASSTWPSSLSLSFPLLFKLSSLI